MYDRLFDTGLIARFSFFTLFSFVIDSIFYSIFFFNILIIVILNSLSGHFNMPMNFGFVGTLYLNNEIFKNVSFKCFYWIPDIVYEGKAQ